MMRRSREARGKIPARTWAAAVSMLMLCQFSALGGGGAGAGGSGIPCGYEVAHVIQVPYCDPFGYPPTVGTGISPNGRYICGFYNVCVVGQPRAFVYDTTTEALFTIPHPPGITSAKASEVTDAGMVCGTAIKSGVGDQGFVYDLNTGLWTPLPSQNGAQGWSFANAINSGNVVCGSRSIDDGGDPLNPQTGFLWTFDGSFADFGLINGQTTQANDLNEKSVVTGTMMVDGQVHAFILVDGKYIDLGTLAGLETVPFAINNHNQVVGRSHVPMKGTQFGASRAFFWSDGAIVDVGTLPGHNLSFGHDVNDDSIVVGQSRTLNGVDDRGFVWHEGVIEDINVLAIDNPLNVIISCNAINQKGHIVVGGYDASFDILSAVLVPLISKPGDLNHTCTVNVDDLLFVINEWGKAKSIADINQDQIVNHLDLLIVIENWTFK